MAYSERQRLQRARKRAEFKKKAAKVDGFVSSLEKQKDVYIDKARDAKARGETATYRLAKTGLNNTVSQLKRAKEMQLNLAITSELKNMSETSSDFLETMASLAKRISKLNKSTNFKKLNKNINAAIEGMQKTGMGLDAVMASTQDSLEGLAAVSGSLDDKQLDDFIDGIITERELTADGLKNPLRRNEQARASVLSPSEGTRSGGDAGKDKGFGADLPPRQ